MKFNEREYLYRFLTHRDRFARIRASMRNNLRKSLIRLCRNLIGSLFSSSRHPLEMDRSIASHENVELRAKTIFRYRRFRKSLPRERARYIADRCAKSVSPAFPRYREHTLDRRDALIRNVQGKRVYRIMNHGKIIARFISLETPSNPGLHNPVSIVSKIHRV